MISRITQIIQNLFIRLEGIFSVFFGGIFGFLGKQLASIGKILGISTASEYVMESDQSQQTKPESTQQPKPTLPPTKTPEPTTRTRPKGKMDDYFLNMAKQVKK